MTRSRRRFRLRLLRTAIGAATLVLLAPALLWAHARLVRSDPAAGARLSASPSAIRLWFSEAPELTMTSVSLKKGDGSVVPIGTPSKGEAMSIAVGVTSTLGPAHYILTWKTAGKDGHPSSGTIEFDVATDTTEITPPPAPQTPATTSPVSGQLEPGPSIGATIMRSAWLASSIAMIGGVAFLTLVLDRAALAPEARALIRRRARVAALIAAVLVIVASLPRLITQHRLATEINPGTGMDALLTQTSWGRAWCLGAAAAAAVAVGIGLGDSALASGIAVVGAIAAAVAPALAGHAAAMSEKPVVAITTDALHLLSASAWLGSLLYVLVAGLPAARKRSEGPGEFSALVEAFSPVALTFAAAVVLTGVTNMTLRLGAFGAFSSPYGRVLIVKLAVFVVLVAVAAYNWRRVKPVLGSETGVNRLRATGTTELTLALIVIIVTAMLIGTPLP